MKKFKIKKFFQRVIWHQVFDGLSIAKSIELTKLELGEPGHKYDVHYTTRALSKYEYQAYRKQLMAELSHYEPEITNSIANIIE